MIETKLGSLIGSAHGLDVELDRGILEVRLNRPPVNAINKPMWERLYHTMRSIHDAPEVLSVLVTTANERVFCAGVDIKEGLPETPYGSAGDFMRLAREATHSVYECPVPIVAAARGKAVGAGAILLALSDLVVGGPGTVLTLSEIDRGVVGGSRAMARLVPVALMRKMMLLGVPVSGEELNRAGAFAEFVADDRVTDVARRIASEIAAKDPLCVRCTEQAMQEVEMMDLGAAYRVEQKYTILMGRAFKNAQSER